jgi:hypothetical protein
MSNLLIRVCTECGRFNAEPDSAADWPEQCRQRQTLAWRKTAVIDGEHVILAHGIDDRLWFMRHEQPGCKVEAHILAVLGADTVERVKNAGFIISPPVGAHLILIPAAHYEQLTALGGAAMALYFDSLTQARAGHTTAPLETIDKALGGPLLAIRASSDSAIDPEDMSARIAKARVVAKFMLDALTPSLRLAIPHASSANEVVGLALLCGGIELASAAGVDMARFLRLAMQLVLRTYQRTLSERL